MSEPTTPSAGAAGVLVWDNQTNAPAYIRLEDLDAALASKRYRTYEASTVKTERLGATVDNAPAAGAAHLAGGEGFVPAASAARQDFEARRREAFDTIGDKALTIAEGAVDALSLGALHEHGDQADTRRDVNSGSAFIGQMGGLAISMLNPASAVGSVAKIAPAARAARGAESLGKTAAKVVFGAGVKGERGALTAARRATEEAVSNAAVGTAMAIGHEASDALIEDKPFAAEHITAALWQDAAFGAGFGAAGTLFGKARSTIRAREAIQAQGGVLDAASPASQGVHAAAGDAVASWDKALENYQARLVVLDVAAKGGELGDAGAAWVAGRRDAVKAAERAGANLRKHDIGKALAGDDPKAVARALSALDDYGTAMAALDDAMRPGSRTMAGMRPKLDITPGQAYATPVDTLAGAEKAGAFDPVFLKADGMFAEGWTPSERAARNGAKGMSGEELRARYRELHGRDYEPFEDLMFQRAGMDDAADNLGGVVTPTSESGTNAGSAKARAKAKAPDTTPGYPEGRRPASDTLVDAEPTLSGSAPDMPPPDLRAPELMGPHPKSSLEAFAYDVESVAAKIGTGDLEAVLEQMGRPGRAPYSLERFRELVGEAEHAGYLATRGPGVEVPYLGAKVGDELVVRGEVGPGWKPDKRARFGRWGDQGNRKLAPDTIVDGAPPTPRDALAEALASPDPLDGKTYKEAQPAGKAPRGRRGKAEPSPDDTYQDGPPSFDEPAPSSADPVTPAEAADPTMIGPTGGPRRGVRLGSAMDDYLQQLDPAGPRYDAGDMAARKVREALDAMDELTDGRVSSATAREAAEAAGLALGGRGPLADHLGAIWGLRQLGKASAEASKGGKHSPLMQKIVKRAGIAAGRQIAMQGNVGQAVIGAAGGAIGGHMVGAALGLAGGVASSAGRARDAVIKAGAALLSGRGSRIAASIPIAARYSYDGSEPTEDVVERVSQLQSAMGDPEATRARIREELGDLAVMHPEVADQAVEARMRQMYNLSLQAPVFVWSALGEPRPAGQQALRRFREYEDATWDLPGLMRDVAGGNISRTRAQALREQYPEAHAILSRQILAGREQLARMSRDRRATIELITGMTLSTRTPDYAARQALTFTPPAPAAPTPGAGAVRAPAPTPASAAFAPGNH